jgi:oxamate amidohydrolase
MRLRDLLAADEGAADLYVEHGPRRVGERFVNRQLAASLRAIAHQGRAWLYEGEGAQHIDRYCRRVNSPLRAADLARHRGVFTTPAAGEFFGSTSIAAPPNSQGIAAIIAQQIYEAYAKLPDNGPLDDFSAARAHAGIEAIRLAFAERDACVGDPREPSSWERLLAVDHARALAQRIDPNAAFAEQESGVDGGDTAYFACVDRAGNAVSFIQSLFHSFGAGVVVPELGFPLQNRGTSFDLAPGRLRSLAPGKRPFHTLMPCMLLREKRPWLVYGSMGGEGQPQTALQICTRIACDEMDVQSAVEAPRWRWGKDPADQSARVRVEARLGAACVAGLQARGHIVEVVDDWDESMGHAGAIAIDHAQGLLTGAADPRGDGAALGV